MEGIWKKACILTMCLMLSVGLSACGESVNLNDYIQVSFEGYDGYGVARVTFDEERFALENPKASFKKNTVSDCLQAGEISFQVSETEGLSNEESVTLSWSYDGDGIKKSTGYEVFGGNMNFTVENLWEVPKLDAFEGVVIRYEGIAPRGTAVLETKGIPEAARKFNYVLDKNSNLSNGDVLTVKIESEVPLDDVEYYMDLCGAVPLALEKEYTVAGLSSYVTELSQIPETKMKEMDDQARRIMEDHVNEMWEENEELAGMELLGNYLLVQKADGLNDKNKLFLVYKNTVKNDDYPEGMDFYYYALFKNIFVDAKGQCSVELAAASVPEGEYSYASGSATGESFVVGKFWYFGFRDMETLFQTKIAPELFEYDYTSTVQAQWDQKGTSI